MTLGELLDAIDYDREYVNEKIQIIAPDGDWDDFDEVSTSSYLLEYIEGKTVKCMAAICAKVIRVELDWSDSR